MAIKYNVERHIQADTAVKNFIDAARANYGTDSYAAGYLNATLSIIAAEHLNKAAYADFIAALTEATAKQNAEHALAESRY